MSSSASAPEATAAAPSAAAPPAPAPAPAAPASASSAAPAAALAALLAAHERERDTRAGAVSRRCADALALAGEVENNARAVLGLELNSAIANEAALRGAVAALRANVGALARECAAHGRAYAALAHAAEEAPPTRTFLDAVQGALARSNAHMAAAAERLTREA